MMKNLDMQEDEMFEPGSWLRSQSFALPATAYEIVPLSHEGTQMTRIARIFTYPCASAQSAFRCPPSAFIRVHPRLIFNREMRERGGVVG